LGVKPSGAEALLLCWNETYAVYGVMPRCLMKMSGVFVNVRRLCIACFKHKNSTALNVKTCENMRDNFKE